MNDDDSCVILNGISDVIHFWCVIVQNYLKDIDILSVISYQGRKKVMYNFCMMYMYLTSIYNRGCLKIMNCCNTVE